MKTCFLSLGTDENLMRFDNKGRIFKCCVCYIHIMIQHIDVEDYVDDENKDGE